MFLIAGLGNPDKQYAGNRHNVGFMAVDSFVRRYNFSAFKTRFQGEFSEGNIGGRKIIVLKPMTYMNNSGQSVRAAVDFYKLSVSDIIVVHDDMDLAFGKVKAKVGGGAGGHNGLKSIDSHCTSNYARLRIGIGRPQAKEDVVNYVLSDFSKEQKQSLETLFDEIGEALPVLLSEGTGAFLNRLALIQYKD